MANVKQILLINAVLLIGLGIFFLSSPKSITQPPRVSDRGSTAQLTGYSNIHPADYVGPSACAKCHPGETADFDLHPHKKMNLNPTETTVQGDFSNRRLDYGDGHVAFNENGGRYLMSLFEGDKLTRQYQVTRTVGSRFTQMYIGVQTEGPEPAGHSAYTVEGKLPFGYWKSRNSWYPESYFDTGRAAEPADPAEMMQALSKCHSSLAWENNCIYCHNTYPYEHRVHFERGSTGFPLRDMEFPSGIGLVQACGPLTPDRLVTLGITCEACHFGGREHVMEGREIRYVPTSPHLRVKLAGKDTRAAKETPAVINSICAQCHCATIDTYPNGAGTWNSREAVDMITGGCGQQLKCTDCHNPHRPTFAGGLQDVQQTVATCLNCHKQFQGKAARSAHTRHAESDHVSCLDCHMPRIVQGLESVVRTHHICSPSDVAMLSNGGPNACNLCHLDRPITWTLSELEKGWGRQIDRTLAWEAFYGDGCELPVGEAWLQHPIPTSRLVAADAISRQSDRGAMQSLLPTLNDEYAVNRMFGLFAIERLLGRQLTDKEYAPLGTREARARQVDVLIGREDLLVPAGSSQ